MKKRVKITTLEWVLDIIFPCYCRGCGKIGSAFCERCIFDNMKNNPPYFIKKDKDFCYIFACGLRRDMIDVIIHEYKYSSMRQYARPLARLMNMVLSRYVVDEEFVLVPLPTISKHIRSRGFDHIKYLCEAARDITGFRVCCALERVGSDVQVGATASDRLVQARRAYKINSKVYLDGKWHFLLVDDVWTTGASMRAARDILADELLRLGVNKKDIKISAICLAKNGGYDFT